MIQLRTLGALELTSSAGTSLEVVLKQPKRTALLCYLALGSRVGFCRRATVLAMFWPEQDAEQARHALRQSLYFLRRSLGPGVLVSRGDDELGIAGGACCDAVEFGRAIDGSRLAEALALYQGDLLPGFFLSDAPEFERWLEGERSRLREQAVAAARKLAERRDREGKPAAAAQWARRALELSPSDESSARQLIVMLDRAGDPTSAVRAFDAFARTLEREYGLSPSDQTRELAARIRARQASGAPHAPGLEHVTTPPIAIEYDLRPRDDADGSSAEKSWRHVGARRLGAEGPASSPRRDRRPIAFAIAAACLGIALGGIAMARGAGAGSKNRALDGTRLFVSVLENRTGDSTLNPIGVMATDWMIQGLSASDSIRVVDSRTAMLLTETGGRTIAQLADASGARFVIAGAYYKEGDSLRFMARLSDATTDRQQWTFTPVVAPVGRPEAALSSLRDQAQTLVAQAVFPLQIGDMLRTRSTPPRYDAYREYVLGVDHLVGREHRSAQQHFLMAARLDTTFTEALLNAATIGALRDTSTADSIMQVLARRREHLSSMSRLWLDATEEARRRDPSALRDLGELARRYPESFFPPGYGLELLAFRHVHEADSVIRSLDPYRGWLRGRFGHWSTLVMLDDLLGDVNAARNDVAAGARAFPHNMGIAQADARYLARAGTLRQLDSLLDEALLLPAVTGYDAASVMAVASLEAAAHGHGDWVPHIRERALRWYASLPAVERGADQASGFELCWLLASVRAWPELHSQVAMLLASSGDSSRWLRYEALAAAHGGDTATLTRLDRRLSVAIDRASGASVAELLAERARVAALRGNSGEAIDLLRQAFVHNKAFDALLHTDPSFETIWSDPRFARLLVAVDDRSR
jgi:DNA-binding SARP family transcriptional activator/TolB-like protein